MSAAKRTLALRMASLIAWTILTILAVGPAFAQDGGTAPTGGAAETTAPDGLDELAARLAPLLVGAALIERALEFVFNWVERAVLDCSHYLHSFAARVTGLITVDLRKAWGDWNDIAGALIEQSKPRESAVAGNPDSADPNDWPLATLEARLIEAREKLEAGQAAIQNAMASPVYRTRKRMAAGWISMAFGVSLAAFTGLRLFEPLALDVPGWFDGPFDILDLVLAGLLMGLGTEWVHQVIGLLIQGKGLLGRAATGTNLDVNQVRDMTALAVQEEFNARLEAMLPEFLRDIMHTSASGTGESRNITPLTSRITAELPATVPDRSAPARAAARPATEAAPEGTEEALPVAGLPDDDASEVEQEAAPVVPVVPVAPVATHAAPSRAVIPLRDTTVTVRRGGAVVRREPDSSGQKLGDLRPGEHRWARGLVWGDYTWLQIPWDAPDIQTAWIPAEQTDFPRSQAYSQASSAWYDAEAVLSVRRALIRDLLRVRGTATDRIDQVGSLRGDALLDLEQSLARQTMMPEYVEFWALQDHLGLPDPFEFLPVHPSPPAGIEQMDFYGFGPNTFAFKNWQLYYEQSRGLHTGVDYIVPEGSPLLAVADGVIESAPAPDNAGAPLVLRPYLPRRYRNDDGSRQAGNVMVYYEHLMGDPIVQLVGPGDEVSAGQIIGTSGWPVYQLGERTVVQRNNPHLHVEVALVTDGEQPLGTRYPFNPLLFWSPRLIALQARLAAHGEGTPYPVQGHTFGRLGFFSVAVFDADPEQPSFWEHRPSSEQAWAPGVYNLEAMVEWLKTFEPFAPARYQTPILAASDQP